MNLTINILDIDPQIIDNMPCYEGEIKIKESNGLEYIENFILSVEYWSKNEYKRQWKEGLERIKRQDTSCLITSIQDPEKAPYIEMWVLFRDKKNKKIYIRNRMLLAEDLDRKTVTPHNCYDLIKPRGEKNFIDEDGNNIEVSEWEIDLE